jgi:hypothetical protein
MRFFIAILLFSSFPGYSQIIEGVVKDSKTKAALPYVHIGVFNKNLGVISNDNGSFTIDISKADQNDILQSSMIGYETSKRQLADIKSNKIEILLESKIYSLKEIIIRPKKIVVTKLGRAEPSKWTTGQSGQKEFGFGAERGLQVIVPKGKKFRVIDARFHIRFNTVDSILFRVNVYSLKNGLPDESLLKKEAFAKSKKNSKWIICDLEDQDLILDTNVVISYEIVRWWFNKGDNEIFLTHGAGYKEGGIYYRLSSQDEWKTDTNFASFPVTMFLSAEEVKE